MFCHHPRLIQSKCRHRPQSSVLSSPYGMVQRWTRAVWWNEKRGHCQQEREHTVVKKTAESFHFAESSISQSPSLSSLFDGSFCVKATLMTIHWRRTRSMVRAFQYGRITKGATAGTLTVGSKRAFEAIWPEMMHTTTSGGVVKRCSLCSSTSSAFS